MFGCKIFVQGGKDAKSEFLKFMASISLAYVDYASFELPKAQLMKAIGFPYCKDYG